MKINSYRDEISDIKDTLLSQINIYWKSRKSKSFNPINGYFFIDYTDDEIKELADYGLCTNNLVIDYDALGLFDLSYIVNILNENEEQDNIQQLEGLVFDMLDESINEAKQRFRNNIQNVPLVELWNINDPNPMIFPKEVTTALLEIASNDYEGKGTNFEKQIKNNVKIIKQYL